MKLILLPDASDWYYQLDCLPMVGDDLPFSTGIWITYLLQYYIQDSDIMKD
jgi:hypothetical protein